jgi:segregation and condensation protein B
VADSTERDEQEERAEQSSEAPDAAQAEPPVTVDAGTEAAVTDPLAEIVAAIEAGEADEEFTRSSAELKAIVEALIFASPEPLTPKALLKLLDNEPKEDVLAAVEELKQDYERPGGLQLVEVAGGYQIVTRADLHEWVRRLFHERSSQKLSVQALESLAVIAYRQPITAIEITEIRGVNASGVLNTLLERHLIKIVGRKQVVGRPFMYATTKEFLIRFGLKDISDLPKVEDMAESLGIESSLLVEQTPPEEQLPLSEPDADTDDSVARSESFDPEADENEDPGPSVH